MDKINNFFGQKGARFVVIGLLFFVILRGGFAVLNNYIEISTFVCTLLSILIGGFGAYKIIWR